MNTKIKWNYEKLEDGDINSFRKSWNYLYSTINSLVIYYYERETKEGNGNSVDGQLVSKKTKKMDKKCTQPRKTEVVRRKW